MKEKGDIGLWMHRACDFNPSPINNTQPSKAPCAHYSRDSAMRFKLKETGDIFIELLLLLLLFILVVLDIICLSVFTIHFFPMWYQVMTVKSTNTMVTWPFRNCSIVTNLRTYTRVSRRSLLSSSNVKKKTFVQQKPTV